MSAPDPHPIPQSVALMLEPTSAELVLNRRGSTVWRVATKRAAYAVKLGYPIEATSEWPAADWTALAPAREGAILQGLGSSVVFYGRWDHGTWNVQPWYDGPDLQRLWAPYRTREGVSRPPLGDALACARALAELHDKGVAHGDVQPAHFLLTTEPARAALIDLALAGGAEVPQRFDFSYRGCLVHYEAPEICRSILDQGTAVPTREADVYGLGATLFMAATGWRHVEYPDNASRPEQRRAIVTGSHRPVNVAGTLGALVNDMLRYDARDRPTAHEVCKSLDQAAA
ncbi:lipopolysaccharide kinase InaA family protein [Streptomyces sp. NPDC057910]|uniref:protein kinase domain-containing protein n=1 Tax=Streptomyces sp. NPDC057910 TaxID=3346278 RepID=UPI0036EC5DE2